MSGIVGNLQTLGPVRSTHLGNECPIYVWLPLSYNDSGDRTYPVLVRSSNILIDSVLLTG